MKQMPKFPFRLISTERDLDEYLKSVDEDSLLWADAETTSLDPSKAKITVIGLYQDGAEAVAVLQKNDGFFNSAGIEKSVLAKKLRPIFESYKIAGHNLSYDSSVFIANGYCSFLNIEEDTMIALHLLDPESELNLETVFTRMFGFRKKTFTEISGISWNKIDWIRHTNKRWNALLGEFVIDITPEMLGYYCAEDIVASAMIFNKIGEQIKQKKLSSVYRKVELPLENTLAKMKVRGVKVDRKALDEIARQLDIKEAQITKEIHEFCGYEFNVASPKQIGDVLFNRMGLPVYKVTKKSGEPATDKAVLERLSDEGFEVADLLIRYSHYSKLNGTYAKGIPKLLDEHDILRANFNQAGTATMRFSSSSPNLQNLPNVNEEEQEFSIRKAFIPRPGYVMFFSDYSAQEYAITAHACGDKNMLKVFEEGQDLHQWVADMAGVSRKAAKAIGFGILYGLSDENLAKRLGVSVADSVDMKARYFSAFPALKPWIMAVEDFARKNRYIRTPVGTIRLFPDFNRNPGAAYRRAVNTCIQGSAAIQTKAAMVKIEKEFTRRRLDAHLLLTIHDELGGEMPPSIAEEVCNIVQTQMENAVPFFTAKFSAKPNVVMSYADGKDDSNNLLPQLRTQNLINPILPLISA